MSVNSPQIRSLLGKLTRLHIQSRLDTEAKPEYRRDEPALEVNMTRMGGEVLSYHFSKPEEASYYVLKRSDLDHYFKVAEYTANPRKETTRENRVQPRTDEASSEPLGINVTRRMTTQAPMKGRNLMLSEGPRRMRSS